MLGLHLKDHMKVGHGNQSQHYAGTAFDVGQRLSVTVKETDYRTSANKFGSMGICRTNIFNSNMGTF